VLPAKVRLSRRDDFALATRRGRRISVPGLVVHAHRGSGTGSPRVGFIVGRGLGNAVDRNLIRRRLQHVMASRVAALPAGSRVVVRATPAAADRDFAALAASVDAALARGIGSEADR
jgi:ribonuclease P protein component